MRSAGQILNYDIPVVKRGNFFICCCLLLIKGFPEGGPLIFYMYTMRELCESSLWVYSDIRESRTCSQFFYFGVIYKYMDWGGGGYVVLIFYVFL